MSSLPQTYYYGLAAVVYLTTCISFAAIRWFHTCRAPREQRSYIWPDRKLQVLVYLCPLVLLPYVFNPNDSSAWMLMKSYFPATYFFYCGMLMLCFVGSVKQRAQWKNISWAAAVIVVATMLIPVLNAWLPFKCMSNEGMVLWHYVIMIEGVAMMGYCGIAIWQVVLWIIEARDANYSNPDDLPSSYGRLMCILPIPLIPMVWPAYILDSRTVMAIEHLLLAVFNIVFLIIVLPAWRRDVLLSNSDTDDDSVGDEIANDEHEGPELDHRLSMISEEIELYVRGEKAFLDQHLKIMDVVRHTSYSRTYVSLAFQRHFGSFANYINGLRLDFYERYVAEHPTETKEAAAQASGFSSYNAYYRANQKRNN